MQYRHVPVMVKEVVDYLNCSPGKTYVDGTLGGGGHAKAILEAIGPGGLLVGIDRDPDAIAHTGKTLHPFEGNCRIFQDSYTNLPHILSQLHISTVDGILLDLGLSLHQLEGSGRGFSFVRDEPLDMRMDPQQGDSAATLVNRLSEKDLAQVIAGYGEEPYAVRIAKSIVESRRQQPIRSSQQLAKIVTRAVPARYRRGRIHPCTRTFQAIRIAVNQELDRLEEFLDTAADLLNPAGRLCILSFHSLEDRIVKERFRSLARGCSCPPGFPRCVCGKKPRISILTKRPLRSGAREVRTNRMARSAKLRVAERLREEGP
jgi:16S rRNA (cytosine1402-N4)-methyltransferase